MEKKVLFPIKYTLCVVIFLCCYNFGNAQIENVIVEKYYITDSLDATDTTSGRLLEAGMITYRVFIDLKQGSKLKKLYGDNYHPLIINSSDTFFNNIDRPNAYFGYLINKSWFSSNPTLALDSWLTIGLNSKTNMAVLKMDDTDGSFIGGLNNNGGSSSVPGGILVNNDPLAGIPVTTADGYHVLNNTLSQWVDYGYVDAFGVDTTIFGSVNSGNSYYSTSSYIQQNSGVEGNPSDSNKVLIGQFTTKGDLSFELNVELEEPDGIGSKIVKYVAKADTLLVGEKLSPYLKYPPICGCKDPNYLEFSSAVACNIQDSCKTLIVFGCTDSAACNYDPSVNYHVQELCCYIGYCYDRDLNILCPDYGNERIGETRISPNPASEFLNLEIIAGKGNLIAYQITDLEGRRLTNDHQVFTSGLYTSQLNISELHNGIYLLIVYTGDSKTVQKFIKW